MITKKDLPFKVGDLVTTSRSIILPDSFLNKSLIWKIVNVHAKPHLSEDLPYLSKSDFAYKIKTINMSHEAYIDDLSDVDLIPYKNALQRIKEKVTRCVNSATQI